LLAARPLSESLLHSGGANEENRISRSIGLFDDQLANHRRMHQARLGKRALLLGSEDQILRFTARQASRRIEVESADAETAKNPVRIAIADDQLDGMSFSQLDRGVSTGLDGLPIGTSNAWPGAQFLAALCLLARLPGIRE